MTRPTQLRDDAPGGDLRVNGLNTERAERAKDHLGPQPGRKQRVDTVIRPCIPWPDNSVYALVAWPTSGASAPSSAWTRNSFVEGDMSLEFQEYLGVKPRRVRA